LGARPDGPNKWSGQVYNPEDGKTYTGNIAMASPDTIKVQGCIMGGVICKTNTWTRGQ
jgi:uncharacterized protein (DUF2147 family)